MIAQLTGSVRSINSDRIILEVAGVGYLIHVTPTAAATLNEHSLAAPGLHLRAALCP